MSPPLIVTTSILAFVAVGVAGGSGVLVSESMDLGGNINDFVRVSAGETVAAMVGTADLEVNNFAYSCRSDIG